MITGPLKSQIDQIWNVFWNGGISNTSTIVEQLTYLIFIRSLGKEKSVFSAHMRGANFGISKPATLDLVMEKLEAIDMSNTDTKGDIYEYLLSKLEGGGTS